MNYEFDSMGGLENGFVFQTINRIVYEVKFIPTPYLFDEASPFASHVYEFSILVANNPIDVEPIFDERTSYTVAAIFTEFYEQNDELITIYICNSSDGRQLTRQRKFNYWFYFFVKDDFVNYDSILRNADGEKYSVALILKEQNPFKAQIIGEFIAIISGYNSDK